jgi:hypothetical protein
MQTDDEHEKNVMNGKQINRNANAHMIVEVEAVKLRGEICSMKFRYRMA